MPGAELQPAPLFYRAEQAHAKFSADFTVHPQSVTVEIDDRIAADSQRIAVTQTLDFQVRYEPLDRLTLDVPRSLFDERKLKFSVGGDPVEAVEAGEQPAADRRSVQIGLPRPLLGPIRVAVQFALPQPSLVAGSSTAIDIPLVDGRRWPTRRQWRRVVGRAGPPDRAARRSVERRRSARKTPGRPAAVDGRRRNAGPPRRPGPRRSARRWTPPSSIGPGFKLGSRPRSVKTVPCTISPATRIGCALILPEGIAAADVELALDGQPLCAGSRSEPALLGRACRPIHPGAIMCWNCAISSPRAAAAQRPAWPSMFRGSSPK